VGGAPEALERLVAGMEIAGGLAPDRTLRHATCGGSVDAAVRGDASCSDKWSHRPERAGAESGAVAEPDQGQRQESTDRRRSRWREGSVDRSTDSEEPSPSRKIVFQRSETMRRLPQPLHSSPISDSPKPFVPEVPVVHLTQSGHSHDRFASICLPGPEKYHSVPMTREPDRWQGVYTARISKTLM
jgi:hypothetical protein